MTSPSTTAAGSGRLVTPAAAAALIGAGETLCLGGDASLLETLPAGNWIGGSIPYFMAQDGGETTRERVFVTRIPPAPAVDIRLYDEAALDRICTDAPDNGFSLVILPAFSQVHSEYARRAPDFPDMYVKPLIGWVAGVHLDDLDRERPQVFDGRRGTRSAEAAVVMHVELPADRYAQVDIVNLFRQGRGDLLRFPETGFSAETCLVNGRAVNFADYLAGIGHDPRFPLVADYSGAMVNVSIKGVDAAAKRVDFYAPVFDDVEYRLADPVGDYEDAFTRALPAGERGVAFACNCILNYLYSELEGKRLEAMPGPMTFGEIAYQLLNQTLVYLTVEDAPA
jgi:hypothetical protein